MDEKKSLPIDGLDPEDAKKILEDLQKNKPVFDTAVLDNDAIFSATDEIADQASAAPAGPGKAVQKETQKEVKEMTEAPAPQAKKETASGASQNRPKQSAPVKKEAAAVKTSEENRPEGKNPMEEMQEKEKVNWGKELRDWVIAIAVAVALSLVIRNFVFTLVKVQGQSMEPTLQNADRLYVNRFFYTPKKGDVVIFVPESDPKRPYVKRVIATEGDSVYIDFNSGDVYVNDQLVDEPYIKEKTARSGSYIMSLVAKGEYGRETPIVVQPGHIFVMGDNRNNSKDSRELGQVPLEEVLGGAVFRFWPMDKFGSVHRDALATSCMPEDMLPLPEDGEYALG